MKFSVQTKVSWLAILLCVVSLARGWGQTGIEWESTGLKDGCITALVASGDQQLFAAAEQPNGVDTMFRSSDLGTTWTKIATGLPTDTLIIYGIRPTTTTLLLATSSGVMRSADAGDHWTTTTLNGEDVSALANVSGVIFAGAVGKVYRSTDEGATWSASQSGLPAGAVIFALAGQAGGPLYAAGGVLPGGGRIYRSTDQGATWQEVFRRGSYELFYALAVDRQGRVFAGSQQFMGGRVYRSADTGATWIQVLSSQAVEDLIVTPMNSLIVAAGAAGQRGGLLSSTDAGQTWTTNNDGLGGAYAFRLAIPKDEKLYIGTFENGVYRSKTKVPVELSRFSLD